MLCTFSFEPYFKSYLYFIVWSLEISEISFKSFSPSSSSSALFLAAAVQGTAAGAVESQAGPLLLRAGAHSSPRSLPTALGLALVLPCSATRPR